MAEYIDKGWALATACSGLTREIEGERWIRVDEVRASLNAEPTKHRRWIYEQLASTSDRMKVIDIIENLEAQIGQLQEKYCAECQEWSCENCWAIIDEVEE